MLPLLEAVSECADLEKWPIGAFAMLDGRAAVIDLGTEESAAGAGVGRDVDSCADGVGSGTSEACDEVVANDFDGEEESAEEEEEEKEEEYDSAEVEEAAIPAAVAVERWSSS